MCILLKEIYREVYGETFSYSSLEARIKMEKAVYFLENMGLFVGDYSFSWDKYGPYSLALDCDAQYCDSMAPQTVEFSSTAKSLFAKVRSFMSRENQYPDYRWVECIASLHYLKYVYHFPEEKLLDELKSRKDYLNDDSANLEALSIIEKIKVGDDDGSYKN